jgi:hypothetical protein
MLRKWCKGPGTSGPPGGEEAHQLSKQLVAQEGGWAWRHIPGILQQPKNLPKRERSREGAWHLAAKLGKRQREEEEGAKKESGDLRTFSKSAHLPLLQGLES